MENSIDINDLKEVVQDLKGIEHLLISLESSEYYIGAESERLSFRAIRNSLEYTTNKLKKIIKSE